jgi:molybdenum-dependent DNA-binding transcriptional regulator ModE
LTPIAGLGAALKREWESMTIDELSALHEQMQEVLSAKLLAKKATLERRLQTLNELSSDTSAANLACLKPSH